ncbi:MULTISPECIES: ATP-binding protein [unclassified Kitasatospora]|uniref:AAA family ATPase n=1 Tax=unclassified Kitasatospora TaxID=2633591 RepID=UPI003411BDF7
MGSAATAVGRPKTLFDRTAEWDALAAFASDPRPGPTIGMVTGPRGQGKSYLLQELARATDGLYFGAQEAAETESLRRLAEQLSRHTGEDPPPRWRGWEEALEAVLALGAGRPVPIVLDGFPELVRQSPSLPSDIQTICHRLRDADEQNRARVLLCGSTMPVMRRLLGSAPATTEFRIEVGRLDYRQGARLWGIADPLLALQVGAVVGSSPAFRHDAAGEDTPAHRDDFDAWVCRTVLNPRLPLFWKASQLIEREPDGWDRALCHSTVAALADSCTTTGAIGEWLERPATDVPHILALLGDCGLVDATPDALRPDMSHYSIAEPLLAFDHAVIRPHHDELERQQAAQVWRAVRPAFESSILEQQFARVCREWALRFAATDTYGAAPATAASGSLPVAPGQPSLEADVAVRGMAHDRPGTLLSVGMARWNEAMDLPHLHEVQQVVAALAERGEDVSRTRPALYSAVGFSPRLRAAEAHGELILVDPERLYNGA